MSAARKDQCLIFTGSDREQYTRGELSIEDIDQSSPFNTFRQWFDAAKEDGLTADAACLSTAELPSGKISSRMVLLKELDTRGFVIYSNFKTSRKAADLRTNPNASLCFWYESMERSIRVEGTVERLTSEESQVYFDTRPMGSRIGAWASQQSSVIKNREVLEIQIAECEEKFGMRSCGDVKDQSQEILAQSWQKRIPVPDYWGGLRIVPERIEFWSGRNNRLHDRLVFDKNVDSDSGWRISRLSP
ncbi:pyridoxamine-phosphate oxidase [Savitreella phatthalungensis]